MTTHIALVNFTTKGIEHIKESPNRAASFVESSKALGVSIDGLYWTSGEYDGVLLMTAPDDESASAATLALARGGFVQTRTLRAFDKDAIQSILGKL